MYIYIYVYLSLCTYIYIYVYIHISLSLSEYILTSNLPNRLPVVPPMAEAESSPAERRAVAEQHLMRREMRAKEAI